MYVCMFHLQLQNYQIGEAARLWRESVLPELTEQVGWKDASFSINSAGNDIRIFIVWESEAQARAFEATECHRELGKLVQLSDQKTVRSIYRLGDAPTILESLMSPINLN